MSSIVGGIVNGSAEIKLTTILEEMMMMVSNIGALFTCQVLLKATFCINSFYHDIFIVK